MAIIDQNFSERFSPLAPPDRIAGPGPRSGVTPTFEEWQRQQGNSRFPAVMVDDPRGGGGQVDFAFAEYLKFIGIRGESGPEIRRPITSPEVSPTPTTQPATAALSQFGISAPRLAQRAEDPDFAAASRALREVLRSEIIEPKKRASLFRLGA